MDFTWLHIIVGLLCILLVPFFIFYCFRSKGLKYFYPYLWNDFRNIKQDLLELKKFRLPTMGSSGLASSVEGLGLGALFIAVFTGFIWFVFWLNNSSNSALFLDFHTTLVLLIEIYLFGHGAMALLHFVLWYIRNVKDINN